MKKINAFFIEDESLLRTLFEDAITGFGSEYPDYEFVMESVPDMKSAMDYLNEKPIPEIIILDLRIPSGNVTAIEETPEKDNGFSILKYVKSEDKFKNTPVIVFTNFGDTETEERAKELKADAFLVKSKVLPVDLLGNIVKLAG